jgi:hypothetical protein
MKKSGSGFVSYGLPKNLRVRIWNTDRNNSKIKKFEAFSAKKQGKIQKIVSLLHAFSLIHFKDCRTIDKYEAFIIKKCISANSEKHQLIHRIRISFMRILDKALMFNEDSDRIQKFCRPKKIGICR